MILSDKLHQLYTELSTEIIELLKESKPHFRIISEIKLSDEMEEGLSHRKNIYYIDFEYWNDVQNFIKNNKNLKKLDYTKCTGELEFNSNRLEQYELKGEIRPFMWINFLDWQ